MRFFWRLCLVLALVSTLPFTPASAQDTLQVTVEGTLVNDVTGEPVTGAAVSLSELDLLVYSDSIGSFRISDLTPGTYWLSVTASGFHAAEGEFMVDRNGVFTIRLEPLDGFRSGEFGQVSGVVRDRATGKALETAQVTLPTLALTALTDSNGRFSFKDLLPGTVLMRTEYLGYETRTDSLEVPAGHFISVEVDLSVEPIELEPLTVAVERQLQTLELAGFYGRREATSGIFLTRDEILEKRPIYTTDIFNSLPGVRVVQSLGSDRAVVLRAGLRPSLYNPGLLCGPTVYLDGMLYEVGGHGAASALLDRFVRWDEIAGIEIYTSVATIPVQYRGPGSDCGVLVIWTR